MLNTTHAETDSMWLQKSITLPDPLPNDDGITPPPSMTKTMKKDSEPRTPPQELSQAPPQSLPPPPTPSVPREADLTKMVLDTSSLFTQRASTARYSTRMSMSNAAFISAHEYDDLRARYTQAKRDLLKLSDVQKDLDFARFELTRSQEELKMLRLSNASIKADLSEALQSVEKERKMRATVAASKSDEEAMLQKEISFLKQQVEELRSDNAKRLAEVSEQQDSEYAQRMQALRNDLAAMAADVDDYAARLDDALRDKEVLQQKYENVVGEVAKARQAAAECDNRVQTLLQQCKELEERHEAFVAQSEKEHTELMQSQTALNEERAKQITESKEKVIEELTTDLQEMKGKHREAANELATLRHRYQQLESELEQLKSDHAKELRRLAEDHRLALCEKQLQMEAAVREARGSKTTLDEENQSLRRHVSKLSEELSTVAAVLAQREKQLTTAERDLGQCKEAVCRLEQEQVRLASDAELNCGALEDAMERVRRLQEEKETVEEQFTHDIAEAKAKTRSLEESLMTCQAELSLVRKEHIQAGDETRTITKELRAQLEEVTAERDTLRRANSERQRAEEAAEEYRAKFAAERQKADNLNVELRAAISRCATLEKRLEEELRRTINTVSRSPGNTMSHPVGLRCTSSVNVQTKSSSMKRARTEDARVFAISGFDGNDLLLSIRQLPNVAIAECKSNMPVPSNLTHLITNGQLTVKLLTALVRGCWILPEAYVLDSLKQRTWLSESEYGFQHADPPLLKKRIALTEAFAECKHYATANLLLKEGGAVVVNSPEEADVVVCTNDELQSYANGINWEGVVKLIYPVKIQ